MKLTAPSTKINRQVSEVAAAAVVVVCEGAPS